MKNRTPTPRDARPALPAFDAVPRKPRHDGWTPERQVAFIEALADTGSVTSAAAQVNMSTESAYALRRAPGAEGFGRAWEAALDMGVLRLKDAAFERALHGELVPVVSGGQLLGYRRKRSDRLLMFVLRHYGVGGRGERVAVEALASPSTRRRRAQARRAERADAPTRTIDALPAPTPTAALPEPEDSATVVARFAGVELDAEAQAQIVAILTACAARAREVELVDDPAEVHVPASQLPEGHPAAVALPGLVWEDAVHRAEGDEDWRTLDLPDQREAIAAAVAAIEAQKASGEWDRRLAEDQAAHDAATARSARFRAFLESGAPVETWEG